MAYVFYGQDLLVENNNRYDEIEFSSEFIFLKNLERHVAKAREIIYGETLYGEIMEKIIWILWHDYTENDSEVLISV